MNKKNILAVAIFFLFIGMSFDQSSAVENVTKSSIPLFYENTLYVGGNGPDNYTKIQDAIDDAQNGDRVFVYGGHYYENILINKSICLQGEHRDITFLNSYYYATVVTVISPDVTIEGFTVQNSSVHHTKYYAGIKGLADNIRFNDLKVLNNGIGFFLQNSKGHHLSSCYFKNNGLYIDNSTNNIILDCWINHIPLIYLEDKIQQQIITAGQVILNNCTNISVDNVSLCNATVGMQILNSINITLENSNIANNNFGGVHIKDSSKVIIKQNFFGDNWYPGIEFWDVNGANCTNNTFSEESNVHIIESSGVSISNNKMTDCGVRLKTSSNCRINNNSFLEQSYGITLYMNCHDNQIYGNILDNISGGIAIEEQSSHNIIKRNKITGGYTGIRLYRYSTENIFIENLVRKTYRGITVEFGCDSNQFIANSIVDNRIQGMSIDYADQLHIINNSFKNNGLVIKSISHHYVKGNDVNNKPLVYKQMESAITISEAGQVILVSCNNIDVENLTLSNTTIGVQVIGCSDVKIQTSRFIDNSHGITLSYSNDTNIKNNDFSNNTWSVNLDESNKNILQYNTINEGGIGFSLTNSHQNQIKENIISGQSYYGVQLSYSNKNSILYNTIIQNKIGVYIDDYIEWLTSFSLTSKQNVIEQNNLNDNLEHNGYFQNGILNSWNNNYWDNIGRIKIIPGEIYAERGWHFGSPPPIFIKCFRIDWHPASEPYDIGA